MQFFLGLFCSSNQRMLLILELEIYMVSCKWIKMKKEKKKKKKVLFTCYPDANCFLCKWWLGLVLNIRLLFFVCEIIWVSSFGRSLGFLQNLFNPRTDSEKKLNYILMVQIC
jgi:hypothetical protein